MSFDPSNRYKCEHRNKANADCESSGPFSPQTGMLSALTVVSKEKTPPQNLVWRLVPLPCIVHDDEPGSKM